MQRFHDKIARRTRIALALTDKRMHRFLGLHGFSLKVAYPPAVSWDIAAGFFSLRARQKLEPTRWAHNFPTSFLKSPQRLSALLWCKCYASVAALGAIFESHAIPCRDSTERRLIQFAQNTNFRPVRTERSLAQHVFPNLHQFTT